VDIAAFNCLLMRVKTASYDLPELGDELRDAYGRIESLGLRRRRLSGYLREWYAPNAAAELLDFGELIPEYRHGDVLRVILSRAARSARRAAHFDLEAPKTPQRGEYWCHKHRRNCRPVESALGFLRRYTLDTPARIEEFARVRGTEREATVLHGDARELELGGTYDGILTSPPYPGLIDYHEQHRYAYELLGLEEFRELELGKGSSRAALRAYVEGVAAVFANVRGSLRPGAPFVIVINDRRDLYPEILGRAGLAIQARYRRHVNRRTGRRAGEFFEDVIVARPV